MKCIAVIEPLILYANKFESLQTMLFTVSLNQYINFDEYLWMDGDKMFSSTSDEFISRWRMMFSLDYLNIF